MALLKEQNKTISYAGDRSTGFAVVLPKLRRLAKIQLGFDLDSGTIVAAADLWR
jgi:hypothetical protein